ncbi:hypothetical protein GUJ93_ZPchr0011g28853 [Zizania palustris]|uniref:Uncharacterized protein n=1 Tax=Zizania palustris TaxID=103762 RepID=A0A8J5WGQ9_ZIZPA|nr:hypothetical protein GUJ93_ZPchr0011g28853 [Zizania palustris]
MTRSPRLARLPVTSSSPPRLHGNGGRDWWCGGGRCKGGCRVEDGIGGDVEADDPRRPRLTTRRRTTRGRMVRGGGRCREERRGGRWRREAETSGAEEDDVGEDGVGRPGLAAQRSMASGGGEARLRGRGWRGAEGMTPRGAMRREGAWRRQSDGKKRE